MGIRCCKCNENRKEDEVIFPKKINYNIFGINNIFNKNITNELIPIKENEKSLNSNKSLWNMDKRYDSIDNSSNDNKFYKYTSYTKSPYLEQIKEIDQKEEDNSTQRKKEDKNEIEIKMDKYDNNKTENNLNKKKNIIDERNQNGTINDFNNEKDFEENSVEQIYSKNMKNQKKYLINKKRKIKLPKDDLEKNNK